MNHAEKILVVEDDALTLRILNFILKKEGYAVSSSQNGLDAIERMHVIQPDLVITDVMLPLKSGLEVTSYCKDHFPHVPVIVLSSLGEEEGTVTKAFNLGADDFVAKPFNPNEFLLRVRRFLTRTEATIAI
ncbi:Transcriptional regulatory protein YycF [Mariniflexile rhizosphaerae]|uniref:response regulator transcription factor n=1 Tax=unclassified Mariniflexile TaxID=2643887 RepID=UPI000CBF294D|nr:response regulator transcription factor [Mariniflexile sp. TRM1-10]AXP82080.1 Transcriptional regulatory protein YycF [Mariniflexile sp. TRM1-10]PLB20277.1 MAG: Two-component response regulator [Flavobacteriaceae bacterium FS1-H7996/R]